MSLAPFVPSPPEVVRTMLQLAELKSGETLYDLGCGDARIVIMGDFNDEPESIPIVEKLGACNNFDAKCPSGLINISAILKSIDAPIFCSSFFVSKCSV